MAAFKFSMVVVVFMGMVATMAFCSSAMPHTVGDGAGWVIPSNPNLYTDWAYMRNFIVGDTLVFNFLNGTHDVAEVSKEDYDQCHVGNRGTIIRSGPATISLTTPGDHYYICSLEGHCAFRQKLAIHVATTAAPSLGF